MNKEYCLKTLRNEFFLGKNSIYNNQNRSASLRSSRTQLLADFLVIDEMAIPDQRIKIVE
jgi:hypothetical protein